MRLASISGLLVLCVAMASCGSDDAASGGASSGTTGDGGASAGGSGGIAEDGSASGGTGGSGGLGGDAGAGGGAGFDAAAGSAGVGGSAGAAGVGNTGGLGGSAGAAGFGGSGGDIVVLQGGPWPDSLTGSCSLGAGMAACPKVGENYYGQDGTYWINVPTYTATADTVHDAVTGLTWERDPDRTLRTQAEAVSYCSDLSLSGYDDWRLPSRLEYVSLLDVGRAPPALPQPIVVVGSSGAHWTSSITAAASGGHFVVNDLYGAWTVAADSNTLLARCVRGPALSGTLQVLADTVIDSMTALEWERGALSVTVVNWQAALAHCEGLTHASRTDWRLPNIKELATIVDESDASAPVIDESIFGTSSMAHYWSSTPAFTSPTGGYAFALQTDIGVSPQIAMASTAAVRCVRQAD